MDFGYFNIFEQLKSSCSAELSMKNVLKPLGPEHWPLKTGCMLNRGEHLDSLTVYLNYYGPSQHD